MDRRTSAPGAAGENTAASSQGLSADEWRFLRATPDYDAEEMSTVVGPGVLGAPMPSRGAAPSCGPAVTARPAGSDAEFPESGSLNEILSDLMDAPSVVSPDGMAAGPGWAAVPSEAEWASLMETDRAISGPPPEPVASPGASAPAPHDALMDALAACERAGLLPRSDNRSR